MYVDNLNEYCRRIFKSSMNNFMCEIGENDLRKSAIIFSPHPDDETLGCGGTIIKKKRFDAEVSIVVLTDGSQSHSAFISREELKFMRARNALAATHVLGVDENDVLFLEFENRKLYENFNSAVQKVKEILMDLQPEEIFIPYYKEPLFWSTDHLATTKVVLSALALSGLNTVINEYPIGFWGHWPWTSTLLQDVWKKSLYAWTSYLFSGVYMLKDFRFFVQIEDVLEVKRAALLKYKTQMTRLFSNLNWPILEDVSNGEFLKCFFQDREVFRRYSFVKPAFIN